MKQPLPLIGLILLSACATITAESEQTISVQTTPPGASCSLRNDQGSTSLDETPGSATVTRSYSPLTIRCEKDGMSASTTLEPSTRGRAYGNILLLGLPAIVDASTGKGYEYDPASVRLQLTAP